MLATALVVWSPYAGSSAVLLSFVLVLVGAGIFLYGRRMKKEIKLPHLGKKLGAVLVVIWVFSILTFLRINRDQEKYAGSAGNLGPIFPITVASAIRTFVFVAYITRQDGVRSAVARGFLALIAGPMVFEFPFLLIVIPRTSAPLFPAIIFLTPFFTIIFTTLAMLFFSRKIAITRYSLYLYGAMILVFAVWALDGYSYPSNPTSFTLNAISKVLGFASVAALFAAGRRKISTTNAQKESAISNQKNP
ncbi:MAG: hypothetical protein ACHQ1H_09270 [Nitrososphaerales archaeon]